MLTYPAETENASSRSRPVESISSARAPNPRTPLRRPSSDPTLGDGTKAPTTPAWAPTPTTTDRRAVECPAFVIDHAADGTAARLVEGLKRLGHAAELITARAPGVSTGRAAGPMNHPLVVHASSVSALAEPSARTIAAHRPGATITYDVSVHAEIMGSPEEARTMVERRVAGSDLVKVSARDLEWLYPDEDHRTVVGRWLSSGPGIVVVSAGQEGAWAMNLIGDVATSAARTVDDDGSGASEAFMAGIIDALWKGGLLGASARQDLRTLVPYSLKELIDNATAAATITARNHGRAPSRTELSAERGIPQVAAARSQ